MSIVPDKRPMLPREVAANILVSQHVNQALVVMGLRGFFDMGGPGNDRGIYDDAIIVTSPSCHVSFNANVDPSIFRPGVATITDGLWMFGINKHGKSRPPELQYDCLEQVDPVIVRRDGQGFDKGMFAIQIHRGSYNDTSSLGCTTIYPDQWDSFISLVKDQIARYTQPRVPYLVLDQG